MPAKYSPEKFWEVFWSKTKRVGPDLLSTIHDEVDGYARCRFLGKMELAHRIAWFYYYGSFPPNGRCVLHTCDIRRCLEREHLFDGTRKDNAEDRDRKGRRPLGYVTGENNYAAKLTDDKVREILIKIEKGKSNSAIAKHYNVSPAAIWFIRKGKRWKHITHAKT